MDRESLEKIRQMTKDKITVSNFQNDNVMEKNSKKSNIKRIAIAVCLCMILSTGILFQNDVKAFIKYCFGNKGVDIAAENGYVEETNMNFIDTEDAQASNDTQIVNDVNVSVKLDEFVMDDINLSSSFSFKFDEKIKEFLDLDNVQFIYLTDLIVYDEENRILVSNCSQIEFEEKCKKYNLDYDPNDFVFPCCFGSGPSERNKEENFFKTSFNFSMLDEAFPKSKELNFAFTKIKLEKYNNSEEDLERFKQGEYLKSKFVVLTGDWKINVKVPEKMYNRPSSEYKIVSTSKAGFMASYIGASETGFKLNMIITAESKRDNEFPPLVREYLDKLIELSDKQESGEITEAEYNQKSDELRNIEKYKNAVEKFNRDNTTIVTNYMQLEEDEEKTIDKITHITNSEGKTFESIGCSSGRREDGNHVTITFDMTKQDATDKLTLTLIYYGEPVEIKLEKIK